MTPKGIGEFSGAPFASPRATPQEQQKSYVSSRGWLVLSQHLSLNQEIPVGWRAGKERRLETRRTWRKRACSFHVLTTGLPGASVLWLSAKIFFSLSLQ